MGKPRDPKSPEVSRTGMCATINQAGGGITLGGTRSGLLLRMG